MLDYGSALKWALKKQGINASELARRTGMTKGAISLYVNNKMTPREPTLQILCRGLGMPPQEFKDKLYEQYKDAEEEAAESAIPLSPLSIMSRYTRAAKIMIFGQPDVSDELLEKVLDYAAGLIGREQK